MKFTEYIQSSSERKNINKLYVFFVPEHQCHCLVHRVELGYTLNKVPS